MPDRCARRCSPSEDADAGTDVDGDNDGRVDAGDAGVEETDTTLLR